MTEPEFSTAFHQHKDAVYRFAWRMTGSASVAEDVAQDCFLALLRAPDRYNRSRGELRAFLLGITRNLILKRWRSEHRLEPLDSDDLVSDPVDLAAQEMADIIAGAVHSLPPLQREALVLAEYEELSTEQIAHLVDAEVGTVKSRLHRARENLRRMLEPLRHTNGRRPTPNGTAE